VLLRSHALQNGVAESDFTKQKPGAVKCGSIGARHSSGVWLQMLGVLVHVAASLSLSLLTCKMGQL
jgi:hypothetical protein